MEKAESIPSTLFYEDTLPRLPLPQLQQTLEQIQKSLEPLYFADRYYTHPLEPEQIKNLRGAVSSFLDAGVSDKLQKKLLNYYETKDCYLDELHLDINSHRAADDGVDTDVLPRNPFLILADDAIPDISQHERAAVLTYSALRFIIALRHDMLTPDVSADGNKPLSMSSYYALFCTTRCPLFAEGEVENFDLDKQYTASDPEEEEWSSQEELSQSNSSKGLKNNSPPLANTISSRKYPHSKHILVICSGVYYSIDVLDSDNSAIYSMGDLALLFDYILQETNTASTASTAVGSLTSHSFKNWKYARKRLMKRYPHELEIIDSALFVLILDESEGNHLLDGHSMSEDCKRLFYGTSVIDKKGHQVGSCISRWYDKLQLVVTADSKSAVIWDSFTCDGSVVLRFVSEVYSESILRLARKVNMNDPTFSLWPHVKDPSNKLVDKIDSFSTSDNKIKPDLSNIIRKIEWSFTNVLNTHIHLSETKLADLICKYDIAYESIPFGRRTAQKLNIKPDSMIQVALQVSHYALYGRLVFGFEPVSIRGFKNSRSCFITLQNKDVLELCQEFISNSLDAQGKLELFIQNCVKHAQVVKNAKTGQSFEKHFNALRQVYKFSQHFDMELQEDEKTLCSELFDNPIVSHFYSPELIVANCGNAATTTFGITPATAQGFGIGYIIKDDKCDLTVTSQFRQGKRLLFMLNWVLREIRSYWRQAIDQSTNQSGVKISPLVDRLYRMDNAVNNLKTTRSSSGVAINGGYGLFDLKGHLSTKGMSSLNSPSNSQVSLKNMEQTMPFNLILSKAPSIPISLPSEKEKQDTGHEIPQLLPLATSDSEEESYLARPETKRNNVINSRFEINFDRSKVGRKVSTFK